VIINKYFRIYNKYTLFFPLPSPALLVDSLSPPLYLRVTLVSQEDQEHPEVRDFLEQRERKDIPDQTEIL